MRESGTKQQSRKNAAQMVWRRREQQKARQEWRETMMQKALERDKVMRVIAAIRSRSAKQATTEGGQ